MTRIAYSSDGAMLALSTGRNTSGQGVRHQDGRGARVAVDTSELRQPEQPGFRDVGELSFVEGDSRVAVAWHSGRLAEWSVADGTLLWSRLDSDKP